MREAVERIGVVGGGTAGFLTALCLNRLLTKVKVTVVESSSVPAIGVGESTTPKLLRTLHHALGIDSADFYREVRPTWKLGLRMVWGEGDERGHNNAFGLLDPITSFRVSGGLNYNSLGSVLMDQHKSFIIPTERAEEAYRSVASLRSFAYHVDNHRLSSFLRKTAVKRGIEVIDVKVEEIEKNEDGDVIGLHGENGEYLEFDFFVDCSGFRSLLLGDQLGVPFESYRSSLFTDSAITGNVEHNGVIRPFTEARTMDNGWQWMIPMQSEDHLGYVYSSAHCSDEEAESEFRAQNPGIHGIRTLRFKSGRYLNCIQRNVAAVGNSYGFIEALQSTALHMVITNIYAVVCHLSGLREGRNNSELINRNLGEIWDGLRWFISMHFHYNRRRETAFWRDCRSCRDARRFDSLIEQFLKEGLLHGRNGKAEMPVPARAGHVFGLFSYDFVLMVLGFRPGGSPLVFSAEEEREISARYSLWDQLAERALFQREALEVVEKDPSLIGLSGLFRRPFDLDKELQVFQQPRSVDYLARV